MEYLDINVDSSVGTAFQRLNSYTALTFLSPGSKARQMVEILGEELGLEAEKFDANVGSALLRGAKGVLLDYIGELFGSHRIKNEKAEVFEEEENFMLYTLEPTFGDINNGENIVIPKGKMLIMNTEESGPSQVLYTNTEEVVLPQGENQIFFSAAAWETGENSNVGANSLVFHDFKNYSDSLNRTLLVVNNESITYGRNTESDDNYRYRIQKEKISGEAGNETAIRLGLLLVPGVADVVRIPYSRGVGTVDWLIRSTSPVVSGALIAMTQDVIDRTQSSGTSNRSKSPNIIGTEMAFSLIYKSVLEDRDKEKIKTEVRKNLADYVNNLDIGENLIIDQIVKVVLNSSDQIESMGASNSSSNFDHIFIHKRSGYSDSIIRNTLTTDYKSKRYERVILEPRVEAPILIRDNN